LLKRLVPQEPTHVKLQKQFQKQGNMSIRFVNQPSFHSIIILFFLLSYEFFSLFLFLHFLTVLCLSCSSTVQIVHLYSILNCVYLVVALPQLNEAKQALQDRHVEPGGGPTKEVALWANSNPGLAGLY
jgi:hypothetical protein